MTIMTPDPNNEKAYKIIDLNLFYNSNDTFRTAVGGYLKMLFYKIKNYQSESMVIRL